MKNCWEFWVSLIKLNTKPQRWQDTRAPANEMAGQWQCDSPLIFTQMSQCPSVAPLLSTGHSDTADSCQLQCSSRLRVQATNHVAWTLQIRTARDAAEVWLDNWAEACLECARQGCTETSHLIWTISHRHLSYTGLGFRGASPPSESDIAFHAC